VEAQSGKLELKQPERLLPVRSTNLRLIFDGRKLGDGGIGVYIDNTVRGLLERGGIEITVISSPEQAQKATWRSEVQWLYDTSKCYSFSEYWLMPRRIDPMRYDLFHSPHYTLPFGISIPTVVTIHDLIHIDHPEAFYYPLVAKALVRSAVARASKVVAVSRDTKEGLLALTGASSNKIVHIPNAVPPFLRVANDDPGNNSSYFLTVVSNCKPHKGVADLLRAWGQFQMQLTLERREGYPYELFLVGYGANDLSRYPELSELVKATAGVRILGAVSNEELSRLYRGARALVVPSLAEGFCFPALEAQSVGTRVVCRPVAALLELITESDLVAKDLSVDALSMALFQAALSDKLQTAPPSKHLERFALSRTTQEILAVYNSVLV